MNTKRHMGRWLINDNPNSRENIGNNWLKDWKAVNRGEHKLGKILSYGKVILYRFVFLKAFAGIKWDTFSLFVNALLISMSGEFSAVLS